jgi:Zn-dependent protease
MDPITQLVAFIIILLFSVIFHEVAHGLMAYRLGDPTAKYAGRLTLNPIPHIDLFGSILLPALLYFAGLPILGAAKPVPVDYRNLRDVRIGMLLISLVGPLTNLGLALLAAAVYRLIPVSAVGESLLFLTVQLNIVLAIFNLIPIPPLDGSKILASILGYFDHNLMYRFLELERFSFILVMLFLLIPGLVSRILLPPVVEIMKILLGQPIAF